MGLVVVVKRISCGCKRFKLNALLLGASIFVLMDRDPLICFYFRVGALL